MVLADIVDIRRDDEDSNGDPGNERGLGRQIPLCDQSSLVSIGRRSLVSRTTTPFTLSTYTVNFFYRCPHAKKSV